MPEYKVNSLIKNPTRAGQLASFLQKDSYINIFHTNNFFFFIYIVRLQNEKEILQLLKFHCSLCRVNSTSYTQTSLVKYKIETFVANSCTTLGYRWIIFLTILQHTIHREKQMRTNNATGMRLHQLLDYLLQLI